MTDAASASIPLTDAEWRLIRAEYLGGADAPSLAAKYGVRANTIYKKAWRDGWTRVAFARARAVEALGGGVAVERKGAPALSEPPVASSPPIEVLGPLAPFALSGASGGASDRRGASVARLRDLALERAGLAVAAGGTADAERLVRVARGLTALAQDLVREASSADAEETEADAARDAFLARIERVLAPEEEAACSRDDVD